MENHVAAQILITFGGLFLLGLIADLVRFFDRTFRSRFTALLYRPMVSCSH